jgi:signal transduction histidine kinase
MGPRPSQVDVAIATVIVVLAELETWTLSEPLAERGWLAAMALVAGVSLAWRRARPDLSALVFMSLMVASTVLWSLDALWVVLAVPLCQYSAGRHASRHGAILALALGVVLDLVLGSTEPTSSVGQYLLNFLFILVTLVGVPWAAGYALRLRAREAERRAAAAVVEDRRRLAREIHDVVGHALGVIAVQAGAERATLSADAPESTLETLAVIERTARSALAEVRRLVDLMNRDGPGDDADRAPLPGLAQVDDLVARIGAAGLATSLRVEGRPVTLPDGLDLSAYRVVQEALTNSLRHAGHARAEVTLRYLPTALEIDVVDDGQQPVRETSPSGHGLTGMRERVALFGGTMRSGPRPAGGYGVHVRLPVEEVP